MFIKGWSETYVAWKPYLSAMMDMTSLSGFLSSR